MLALEFMLVILEGPKRCGKTTVANYLVDNHRFVYFKDMPVGNALELSNVQHDTRDINACSIFAQAKLLLAMSNQGINIVVDRFHISEVVYGRIYRGYESNAVRIAENVFNALPEKSKCYVAYIRRPYEEAVCDIDSKKSTKLERQMMSKSFTEFDEVTLMSEMSRINMWDIGRDPKTTARDLEMFLGLQLTGKSFDVKGKYA